MLMLGTRRLIVALLIGATAASAAGRDALTRPVARLGPSWLDCGIELAAERCASDLLRRVRAEAEREYITSQGIDATPEEIEAVRAYDVAFRAHDRSQRSRKLAELVRRLDAADLAPAERHRLEAFRATLERLARYDADVDAGIEPRNEPSVAQMTYWIEQSKLDAALHRRYGGVIGLSAAGPYAHGARAALVADYLKRRVLEFVDADVGTAFQRQLGAPPAIVFRDEQPDFMPFWQRAIPASYMPD